MDNPVYKFALSKGMLDGWSFDIKTKEDLESALEYVHTAAHALKDDMDDKT